MSTDSGTTTYFITGGNREIGFNLVKNLSSSPSNIVIASYRGALSLAKNRELVLLTKERTNVHIVELDVTQESSIEKLSSEIEKITAFNGIDIVIANSGIADSYLKVLDAPKKLWWDHYTTNTLGPVLTLQKLNPLLLLKTTRQIFFISTIAASITGYIPVPFSAQGQSKAALNYTIKELSFKLKEEGFTVVAFHLGMVPTDMGNYAAAKFKENDIDASALKAIAPEESASSLLEVFAKINSQNSGKFYSCDGSKVPY